MNGDLLTTLNYRKFWEQHSRSNTIATVATYQRDAKIELGVIETDEQGWVRDYIEKPTYHYIVSTGIYIFSPTVLDYIPLQKRFDLPDLIRALLTDGYQIATHPFDGYWLDIGRHDDYEQAIAEFEQHRNQFIPTE